ncbi:hypothetical protein AMQ83_11695 [Paenibacillus riograndensis]|nr:hypothetical protein AMQ83_11695 [Paenibacillus riograndensis]
MSLYESGGFKSDKGGMADVVSTFNAVAALSKLNSLDKEIVANILKFTASLKNKDSEIKISKLNDYADLSTIYYAYRLLSLIEIY